MGRRADLQRERGKSRITSRVSAFLKHSSLSPVIFVKNHLTFSLNMWISVGDGKVKCQVVLCTSSWSWVPCRLLFPGANPGVTWGPWPMRAGLLSFDNWEDFKVTSLAPSVQSSVTHVMSHSQSVAGAGLHSCQKIQPWATSVTSVTFLLGSSQVPWLWAAPQHH